MPRFDTAPITVFYDGACAVCALEMSELARRDAGRRLVLVDIAAPGFDARAHGFTAAALEVEIHAVDGDRAVWRGMAALRLAYDAAGIGWRLRLTGSALLRPAFDAAYRLFARHRRPISGILRPAIGWVAARRARRVDARMRGCVNGACQASPHEAVTCPPEGTAT